MKLFADSAGYCQNPDCNVNLFLTVGQTEFHIAEMAHIISAGQGGPRTNQSTSEQEKGDFSNLILLCPTCHTKIDKAEQEYPEIIIKEWKKHHSEKINSVFNIKQFKNRTTARQAIVPILNENKAVFDIYGPLTDYRYNPESEIPKLWLSKIQQIILPNNRKLLRVLDNNYTLISDIEAKTVEIFRQHVLDLEAKHINQEEIEVLKFPSQLHLIFEN
ncbi:HNH endonuclease [Dyadobacter soli]|uniref:HNH endonuclease n=1 Tax=Dyadobacter soli TaxID=659014 RepID=UPI0015A00D0A|nr:HNH endonuclease [Dyadobacter soli]